MDPIVEQQISARLRVNEGCRLTRYFDTLGVPTIAFGFNLERGDADDVLRACGVAEPHDVIAGGVALTQAQADALLAHDLPNFIAIARASLAPGIFDALCGPRQAAVVDLAYNLGESGWGRWGYNEGFAGTRQLIVDGQDEKHAGQLVAAHAKFVTASAHLLATPYAAQVGDRAKRNAAMIRTGEWCAPTGDGSDVA